MYFEQWQFLISRKDSILSIDFILSTWSKVTNKYLLSNRRNDIYSYNSWWIDLMIYAKIAWWLPGPICDGCTSHSDGPLTHHTVMDHWHITQWWTIDTSHSDGPLTHHTVMDHWHITQWWTIDTSHSDGPLTHHTMMDHWHWQCNAQWMYHILQAGDKAHTVSIKQVLRKGHPEPCKRGSGRICQLSPCVRIPSLSPAACVVHSTCPSWSSWDFLQQCQPPSWTPRACSTCAQSASVPPVQTTTVY